ncbi:hypothetical protein FPRO03_03454 [Fusarium proliferatum]|nr:hypothetical protein FPRO03_03454 [Fusarium proliferatum]
MNLSPVSPGHPQPIETLGYGCAGTVACRLRTPIAITTICQDILRVTEVLELEDYIRVALNQLTILERSSIRSFAHKVSRACDKYGEASHSTASPSLVAESANSRRPEVNEDVPNLSLSDERQQIDTQATNSGAGPISIWAAEHAGGSTAEQESDPSNREGHATRAAVVGEPTSIVRPVRDPVCDALLDQSVADFVYEIYCQVQRLSLPGKAPEQDKALMDAFRGLRQPEEESAWSDGSQLTDEMEAADNDRYVGSLRTAALSVNFARWHQSQVRWLESAANMATQSATNSAFERGIGPKPQQPGASQEEWKRRRQRSSTFCTRGKKWLRLLDIFDNGIFVQGSRDAELDALIKNLTHQIQKMDVLGLLSEQITLISNTGSTDPEQFRKQLIEKGYPDPCATSSTTGNDNVDAFLAEVCSSSTSGRLLIPWAKFQFDMVSLQRLVLATWLNDDIILACLHLSTKLPFVRVGFSVPIHRQTATRAGGLVPDPFQRASNLVSEKRHSLKTDALVENSDIKTACNREFAGFEYIEKETMRQNDFHSCGPLVIKNARDRMMGRPVASGASHTYDATELRMAALRILRSAWSDGALTVAPMKDEDRKHDSLNLEIDPANVRLKPSEEDLYRWQPSSGKEHLFEKHLSKLSVGPLMELCKGIGTSFKAVHPSTEVAKQPWNEMEDLKDEVVRLREGRSEAIRQAKSHIGKYKRENCELKRRNHKQQRLLSRYRDVMMGLLRDTEYVETPTQPHYYNQY